MKRSNNLIRLKAKNLTRIFYTFTLTFSTFLKMFSSNFHLHVLYRLFSSFRMFLFINIIIRGAQTQDFCVFVTLNSYLNNMFVQFCNIFQALENFTKTWTTQLMCKNKMYTCKSWCCEWSEAHLLKWRHWSWRGPWVTVYFVKSCRGLAAAAVHVLHASSGRHVYLAFFLFCCTLWGRSLMFVVLTGHVHRARSCRHTHRCLWY